MPSEPPTDETGCSSSQGELLPTPVVVDNPHPNSKVNENGRRYNNKAESSHSMGLADMAMHGLLPTPVSQGLKVCDKNGKTRFIDLSLLPTPTAGEALKWRNQLDFGSQMGMALNALAVNGLLPTPLAVEREHPDRVKALKEAGATRINSRVNGEQRPNGILNFLSFMGVLDKAEDDRSKM